MNRVTPKRSRTGSQAIQGFSRSAQMCEALAHTVEPATRLAFSRRSLRSV